MEHPRSTYRIQFNKSFTFNDAVRIIPYLNDLGVSHLYASPVFKAKPGSTHGYDIVDPNELNPEIGSLQEFERLIDGLKQLGMGWIQDIVPNHMAFDSSNPLITDLLENGPESLPLHYFDINWNHPYEPIRGRLLAPFLGDIYGECLERGEITIGYDETGFHALYFSNKFPLKIETYYPVLSHRIDNLRSDLGDAHSSYVKLLGVLFALRNLQPGKGIEERKAQVAFIKSLLHELYTNDNDIHSFIETNVTEFNGVPGKPATFGLLDSLLSQQVFKLCYWKVATEELDYRRFFAVNDLISVRVEDRKVFDATHRLVFELCGQGRFSGVRVDHIDGLYDPREYLGWLRNRLGDAYIVVEKILGLGEPLPAVWPVQGTTGYDYLNNVNSLFCMPSSESEFDGIYQRFTGSALSYPRLVVTRKKLIIENHMGGDIENLALLLRKVSRSDRRGTDMTLYGLRRALVELMAYFPVYRTYIDSESMSDLDRAYLDKAVQEARLANPGLARELTFIGRYLMLQFEPYTTGEERSEWVGAAIRFQQFTGPLMAKGFEDTTLYIYNRLLSLNEVGGWPDVFGITPSIFHEFNKERSVKQPFNMNATATHDTKRGEDARARINALSEIPREWEEHAARWKEINARWKRKENHAPVPDENDEYFFYQSCIGGFPFNDSGYGRFVERIVEFMLKAVREAKVHTEWIRPDTGYENGIVGFVNDVLDREKNRTFFDDFLPFQERITRCGVYNSLSQCLLKLTCPGIPDIYRGCELWDLSFVDPDNRRPADHTICMRMMNEIKELSKGDPDSYLKTMLENPSDGKIKMYLIRRLLMLRKDEPGLFDGGEYIPLEIEGDCADNLIVFARRKEDRWAVIVAPRFFTKLTEGNRIPVGSIWKDTRISIPPGIPHTFTEIITGKHLNIEENRINTDRVMTVFPGAVLVANTVI